MGFCSYCGLTKEEAIPPILGQLRQFRVLELIRPLMRNHLLYNTQGNSTLCYIAVYRSVAVDHLKVLQEYYTAGSVLVISLISPDKCVQYYG